MSVCAGPTGLESYFWAESRAGLAAVLGMGAAIVGALSLARALRTLKTGMRRLAAGDLDADIGFARRKDEVGSMARAVEVFRRNDADPRRFQSSFCTIHNL